MQCVSRATHHYSNPVTNLAECDCQLHHPPVICTKLKVKQAWEGMRREGGEHGNESTNTDCGWWTACLMLPACQTTSETVKCVLQDPCQPHMLVAATLSLATYR